MSDESGSGIVESVVDHNMDLTSKREVKVRGIYNKKVKVCCYIAERGSLRGSCRPPPPPAGDAAL